MGILVKGSVLGDITGKIGDIQLSKYLDATVIKSLPTYNKNRKVSEVRKAQNALFALVATFLSFDGGKVFKRGYQFPKKQKMTAHNAATQYHVLNAVTGDYPDCKIDLTKMKFTMPLRPTENGWNAQFSLLEEGGMSVSWEINDFPETSTRLDDEAVAVFFKNDHRGKFSVINAGQRRNLGFRYKRRLYEIGAEYFCWLFFISADGKLVSETKYLGMLKMS